MLGANGSGRNGQNGRVVPDSAYAVHPDEATDALKGALLGEIRRSCFVYRVDCGGCNGCEIEIFAAITPVFDAERFGIKVVSSPRHADILLYTGSVTRAMRVPALRAYHAAPEPKICVAYGACGCSGGIFHDLYCTWGGADRIVPVDLYIPGCPPTPPATIYGFALALGLLGQKLHAGQAEEQPLPPERFAWVPHELRVAIEREARRMAGYWRGKQLAQDFLAFLSEEQSPGPAGWTPGEDPRLDEIIARLQAVYQAWQQGGLLPSKPLPSEPLRAG